MPFTHHNEETKARFALKTAAWYQANPEMKEIRTAQMRAAKKRTMRKCHWCWDEFASYNKKNVSCKGCIPYDRFEWHLQRDYKISFNEFQELFLEQNGACAICLGSSRLSHRLAIDHDHMTGEVRGLLCESCNLAIGKMKDNPELLRKAADYLEAETTSMTREASA